MGIREILEIVASFLTVTILTILADRYLGNRAAFIVLGISVGVLCWLRKDWLILQLRGAQQHRVWFILVCTALFAAIGALIGIVLTQPKETAVGTTDKNEPQMKSQTQPATPIHPANEASLNPSSQPTVNGTEKVSSPVVPIVHLMFKDAALLTPGRQKRITDEINGVTNYLKSFGPLGLPIPDDLPPIGIDTKNPKGIGWSFNSQGDNKYYYNQFTLQQGALNKQTKITEAFLSFVAGRFIYKPPPPMPSNIGQMTPQQFFESTHTPEAMDQSYRWMTSTVVVQYLNHSYWNVPFAENEKPVCPDQGNGMSYYFWQMRERFGKEFADRLAVLTLRASVDKPYTGAHTDAAHPYRYYLYERLTMADSIIDNENSKMPEIDSILKQCGWLPLT